MSTAYIVNARPLAAAHQPCTTQKNNKIQVNTQFRTDKSANLYKNNTVSSFKNRCYEYKVLLIAI
jgi:hypothetical protein